RSADRHHAQLSLGEPPLQPLFLIAALFWQSCCVGREFGGFSHVGSGLAERRQTGESPAGCCSALEKRARRRCPGSIPAAASVAAHTCARRGCRFPRRTLLPSHGPASLFSG